MGGFSTARSRKQRAITFGREDSTKFVNRPVKQQDELADGGIYCSVGTMHQQLGQRISTTAVQDSGDEVHIDVSVINAVNGSQRYSLRLHQHRYYSNMYERRLFFSDLDVGGRVEMFMRLPCTT